MHFTGSCQCTFTYKKTTESMQSACQYWKNHIGYRKITLCLSYPVFCITLLGGYSCEYMLLILRAVTVLKGQICLLFSELILHLPKSLHCLTLVILPKFRERRTEPKKWLTVRKNTLFLKNVYLWLTICMWILPWLQRILIGPYGTTHVYKCLKDRVLILLNIRVNCCRCYWQKMKVVC